MPRNRKIYAHDWVHFVTTRITEGLPLIPCAYIEIILKSILARAAALYPVKISDLIVMANHIHLLLTVINPDHVDKFMRYFKTESGHAINRMLGRPKGSVWDEGYDAPVILDMETLIDRAVYIYANPQRAGLVPTIEEYPHFSSWQQFTTDSAQPILCHKLRRPDIKKLPRNPSAAELARMEKELLALSSGTIEFHFEPAAAFEALGGGKEGEMTYAEYRGKILQGVRSVEQEVSDERLRFNKRFLGADMLRRQSPYKFHRPKKYGKRMICMAADKALRSKFISCFKACVDTCREVFQNWKETFQLAKYPPGFFPATLRTESSLLPAAFLPEFG